MTPEALSALHCAAMDHGGWSAKDVQDLLASPGTFLALPPSPFPKYANPPGFALGRVTLDEAELLTLVTDPALRRQGLGRSTLAAFEAAAIARGARQAFLEVAQGNHAARQLYLEARWVETGQRKGYYKRETGREDAILMGKALETQ